MTATERLAPAREATLIDRLHQIGLFCAFQLMKAVWFVTRPNQHGALVLIREGDRVLLLRNSYQGLWSLPGGSVEAGEGAAQAAAREIHEEIGLRVDPAELDRRADITLPFRFRNDRVELFEWHPRSLPEIRIDHREVVELRWFTLDEARRLDLIPHIAHYLAGATQSR